MWVFLFIQAFSFLIIIYILGHGLVGPVRVLAFGHGEVIVCGSAQRGQLQQWEAQLGPGGVTWRQREQHQPHNRTNSNTL